MRSSWAGLGGNRPRLAVRFLYFIYFDITARRRYVSRNARKQLVGKQRENNDRRELARKLREFEQAFRREQYARQGAAR